MAAVAAELHEEMQLPVPSISIDNLLNVRDGILASLKKCLETYQEASASFMAAGFDGPGARSLAYIMSNEGRYSNPFEHDDFMAGTRKRLDAAGWDLLMKESGMWSLMDATARKEWQDKIHDQKVPVLTRENITATFEMLHASRGDIFDRGVIEVFRGLSWNYKTNNPFRLGKRLVLTYLTSKITGGQPTSWGFPQDHKCNAVDDLLRCMSILDGKPEPDHRGGTYSLVHRARQTGESLIEHDYLSIKLHKNGNGHVTFKRTDLVDRMNLIIAKHYPGALPAPRD